MKVWLSILLFALVAGGVLTAVASHEPFEPRMVRLETQRALPSLADGLAEESPAINALFLNYADDPALWTSAWLAIRNHGDLAREALLDYGLDPEFQKVLVRFGADAVLPVIYYRDHDIATLRAQHWLGTRYRQASEQLDRWWGEDDESDEAGDSRGAADPTENLTENPAENPTQAETGKGSASTTLTPTRRGQVAIAILAAKGHAFLQQFVVTPDNDVSWLQGERVVSDIGDFFTSGLRDLESQWRRGEAIGVADIGWAGVDLLVMTSAIKVLRAGRAVRAGAAVEGQGARAAGRGVLAGGGRFVSLSRAAKIAAVTGTAYVVVRHPSLVSALGANAARWLGWPVWLSQFLIWVVVLLPLLIVVRFVYRWLLAPLLWLLVPLLKASSRTPRWLMKRQRSRRDGTLTARPQNDFRTDPTL
ncbi:hypothetical protein BTW08_11805 [Salinicola sp. MH3R3-1]|uniref:hypothetical protein n=1 Tax=Salinicola sp. MH3R3-1 TaxID=1928762 RepID=UPI00094EF197|nr:hypothetical protein [Salinicola sp. MH3R3-1]OLO07452.1 hypothetical protein BTW08_11805 [Salinicola sp. MH3R3-1]